MWSNIVKQNALCTLILPIKPCVLNKDIFLIKHKNTYLGNKSHKKIVIKKEYKMKLKLKLL